jgi:exopolysaccharide biosynthesis polyprenyl glycosylphosphotransferase
MVLLGFMTVLLLKGELQIANLGINEGRDLLLSNAFFLFSAIIFFRIYNSSVIEKSFVASIFSVLFSLVFSNITAVLAVYFIEDFSYDKNSFLFTIWIQLFYISVWKYLFSRFIGKRIIKTALIVGIKEECEQLARKLISTKNQFIKLKYMACEESDWLSDETYNLMEEVDQIYVTPNTHERIKQRVISYTLGNQNKDAILVPKTHHVAIVNSKPYQISDILTLKVQSLHISLESQIIKRTFDIIVSFLGLLILSPILILIALVIKIYDGGPVFFRQFRVTQSNTEFKIFKFRSMIPNAEKHTGAVQASEHDPRITPFGRIMRATRIDELPQLINVLKGDMSIVGPRALRIEEVKEFTDHNSEFAFRAHVKAGITGLAQIVGKYDTSFEDKLRLDLMYIRNYSFLNDLILIIRTVKVVFDKTSAQGVSLKLPFEEFIKYYGYCIKNINEKILKITKVVE